MRLNLLNQTVVVADAVEVAGLQDLNPRFGEARLINTELFKYSSQLDPSAQALIGRVDMGKFLEGIPQDISGITFGTSSSTDLTELHAALDVDTQTQVPSVDSTDAELVPEEDTLGQLYVNWTRLIGLGDVPRSQVDLGSDSTTLYVTFTRSPVFCGAVEIKIK